MKPCFVRTETDARAYWSLDYAQADEIFNAEKRSSASWKAATGQAPLPTGPTAAGQPALVISKGNSVKSSVAKVRAPKKIREAKMKKGMKSMGTQTLQSSKSCQTDITLATLDNLDLPNIECGPTVQIRTATKDKEAILRIQRGAFSSAFDSLAHQPAADHRTTSIHSAAYPGNLHQSAGLGDVDVDRHVLDDFPFGNDDDDDDDDVNGGGFGGGMLAQSWGGFPTGWKDNKSSSFESLF